MLLLDVFSITSSIAPNYITMTYENTNILKLMPFCTLTNYKLSLEFPLAKIKYTEPLEGNNIQRHLIENIPNQIVDNLTCKYYDEESLNYTTSHINSMLSLIHLNLGSSFKKLKYSIIFRNIEVLTY